MEALQRDIQETKGDMEKNEDLRAADRRLIFTALVAPVLMLLLTVYLASKGATS